MCRMWKLILKRWNKKILISLFRYGAGIKIIVFVILLLTGCTLPLAERQGSPASTKNETATRTITVSATVTSTLTETLTPSATQTATPTITPTPTPSYVVELAAVGDIMLARGIAGLIYTQGIESPFAGVGVREVLTSADLALGNLECALTERGQAENKTYVFAAPPDGAKGLAWAGFDLVTLGNNHILDYGVEGLEDTLRTLDEAGVAHVGAGKNAAEASAALIIERNGLRIAFLAFVDIPIGGYDYHTWEAGPDRPGIIWGRPAAVRKAVQAAREQADLVVALMHFGYEGLDYESPEQETLAETAIDAGAALVIGSHSHMLQPVKEYHGGLIVYSLGNFVFDEFEFAFNKSMILRVRLGKEGVLDWTTVPVEIVNGVPQVK